MNDREVEYLSNMFNISIEEAKKAVEESFESQPVFHDKRVEIDI